MQREAAIISKEYGRPDGWRRHVYRTAFRLKRQWQKLVCRGRIDLIPGSWILRLRRQMKKQTHFVSNIDMNKLQEKR
jgi:hypothetical protein